jgi:hypothetical protein
MGDIMEKTGQTNTRRVSLANSLSMPKSTAFADWCEINNRSNVVTYDTNRTEISLYNFSYEQCPSRF